MTSQLRKKRPITAPTLHRVKRAKHRQGLFTPHGVGRWLVAWVACGVSLEYVAPASSQEAMRPVPRFSGASIRDQRSEFERSAAASKLQWRTSTQVAAPAQAAPPAVLVAALPTSPATPVEAPVSQTSGVRDLTVAVSQARYQNAQLPPDDAGLTLPPGLQSPGPLQPSTPPSAGTQPLQDFYSDPFGEDLPSQTDSRSLQMPSPALPPAANALRSPAPLGAPVAPGAEEPATSEPAELPSPGDQSPSLTPANPFDRTRSGQEQDADRRELEDFDMPLRPGDRSEVPSPRPRNRDEDLRKPVEFSCDEFRRSIAEDKIQKVSLDISPPFRPDVIELDEFQKLKSKFEEAQQVRDWQSVDGRMLGRGRLRDLAYEKIVIETEHGTIEELALNRASEADLAYLSKNWGLPTQCLIEQAAYEPRSWTQSKITWKASNLCHKPLYFEEVNLERYGHTAGPFAQPIISSAHFFANIAVLPYKMGVHAPSECQYTLGYYRPGNCAPWIVPPVPISLRGGLYQAAAMTGAFWLIP